MSEPAAPELRAVPGSPEPTGSEGPKEPHAAVESMAASEAPARQRPWLVIGLVVALVIAGLAYVSETARSTQLEGQVASLDGELQSANESLQAYEQRMDVVRAQVAEVSAQMALLEQAVAEAPE